MKVSLIATVLNEENSIEKFLDSVVKQTKLPEELVIVDGGSTDSTESLISNFQFPISNLILKLFKKRGNRSVGRNEAIKRSTGNIIAITDSGCILDKNWLKDITAPFVNRQVDVVAGYYKAKSDSIFEKCLVPYVLVMLDKVDPDSFLPAARSMALRKSIWEEAGKFDEKLSHNEDYAFAKKIKQVGANIIFEKKAIVYWIPRKNIHEAFVMFFRFALGDVEAGIFRPKAVLVALRYLIGFILIVSFFVSKLYLILNALYFILAAYVVWSIVKNYRYVNNYWALFILPILQITSDVAVILGTSLGITKRLMRE